MSGDERYYLEVVGGCMEPDIPDGGYVLVDANEQPTVGGVVVYLYPNGDSHVARLVGFDGSYYTVQNNRGVQVGLMADMLQGVVVEVVPPDDAADLRENGYRMLKA